MASPAGETAAVVEGGDGQQQRQAGGFGQTITGIIRIAVFCYFASKFFSPKQKPADPSKPTHLMSNLFQRGEPIVIFWLIVLITCLFVNICNFIRFSLLPKQKKKTFLFGSKLRIRVFQLLGGLGFFRFVFLFVRICGFIFRSMRNSMTSAMKVRLFGMRQTYLMLCGNQRALGPCQ
jgi:hypothetical protein